MPKLTRPDEADKSSSTNTNGEADSDGSFGVVEFYGDLGPMSPQATFDSRAFEPLCEHLAIAYADSQIGLTDGLIRSVIAVDQSTLSVEDPPSVDRVFAGTFADLLANASDREREMDRWERTTSFWAARLEEVGDAVPSAFAKYAGVLSEAPPPASLDDVVELLVSTAPAIADTRYDRRVLEFLAAEVKQGDKAVAYDAMAVLTKLVECADQSYRLSATDERWTIVTKAAKAGDDRVLHVAEQFFEQGESEYKQIIERHKTEFDSA